MRIGPAQANQNIAIGSTDGTNGGRLSLGYGGNSTPTVIGNSTWTLQAFGTEFRLVRVNSGGSSLVTFSSSETGATQFFGSSGTFSVNLTGPNLGIEYRNTAGGLAFMDWTLDAVRDLDFRFICFSSTDFRFQSSQGGAAYQFDTPLRAAAGFRVGATTTGGARTQEFSNSAGTITLSATPTANRTITVPDNDGRITITKTVTVTSSKTLALTDIDSIQFCQHTAASTITVPTNAAVAIPVGSEIRLINFAPEHRLTIATSGVTLFNQANLPQIGTDIVFVPDEAEIRLIKVATDSWILTATNISPRLCHSFYSDCFSLDDPNGALIGANTGNSVIASAPEAGSPGILTLSTGTAANGRFALYTAATGLFLGSRRVFFESRCRVSALANVTDNFEAIAGLCDSITATPANGVFFRHSTQNSGNWQAVCRAAGSESVLNTSVASTIFASLTFLINRDGTSVEFWADGTSLGTLSTNIPNGLAQPIGFSFAQIRKTAGTTARGVAIDRYHAMFDI